MMCLRRPRKPLVPQLKRRAAASSRKQQLCVNPPAALIRAPTSLNSSLAALAVRYTAPLTWLRTGLDFLYEALQKDATITVTNGAR